jgi:hypothetical protein
VERLGKIRDDAARRLEKSGDEGGRASIALMLFEAADGEVNANSNGSRTKSRSKAKR